MPVLNHAPFGVEADNCPVADASGPCCYRSMTGSPNYNALQNDVGVGRGWCGGVVNGKPSHVDYLIPDSGLVTADQFVEWLFIAEGLDPHAEPDKWEAHKAGLRDAFIQHMGADVADAATLKWDVS